MPTRILLTVFMTVLMTLTSGALATPTVGAQGPIPYTLLPEAYWQTGCLPPCLCPILFSEDLTGTFTREFAGYDVGVQVHAIDQIVWQLNNAPVPITGLGTWRLDEGLALQQLTLFLEIDGVTEAFDSGWVAWTPVPPDEVTAIDIPVAMNGFICFDTVYGVVGEPIDVPFRRGDCNADGGRDIADVIRLLEALFTAGDPVDCLDACDANDDGSPDIADAVRILDLLFAGGPPLAEPFDSCGSDPTPDFIGCDSFGGCP